MPDRNLMKGTEAICRGAILAGCNAYYGYPITPQSEIGEYLSVHLPEAGGTFLQGESEVAVISYVMGASMAGIRVMTSTSCNGYSLMLEGISQISSIELPAVLVHTVRGGPGTGGGVFRASQLDYFSTTKGGGHGGYRSIVLAPSSPQDMLDYTQMAFDLADKYRLLSIVLCDGVLAQMMEGVEVRRVKLYDELPPKTWALTGKKGRPRNILLGFRNDLDGFHEHLVAKHREIADNETRFETIHVDDAEIILVAYGLIARMVRGAVDVLRAEGLKVGMLRPITLWPFPLETIRNLANPSREFFVVEANKGQMLEDVERAVQGRSQIRFYGKAQSLDLNSEDIADRVRAVLAERHGEPMLSGARS